MSFERTTPCGVISGMACQWPGIAAYKGIRYATAGHACQASSSHFESPDAEYHRCLSHALSLSRKVL